MRRRVPRHAVAALLPTLVLIRAAGAESLSYGVDIGLAESDNVRLVHEDKISQTMAVADADIDYLLRSSLLDVNAKGNFTYLDYLQNAYHDQLLGRFDGSATVAIAPERLTWTVQEVYGQMTVDPFTPSTPTNIQSVNYLSTGPDLHLRFGGLSYLDLGARVSRAQYESSPFSSDRGSGTIAWGWQLSAQSTVSLNADSERVLFENTRLNSDFDRSNIFVRYATQAARTEFSADMGATVVMEEGSPTRGGLAKISLSRQLSASSKLILTLGRELTDASSSFVGLQSGALGSVGTAPAATTSANYTSSYSSLGWLYARNRTTIAITARWERDLYPGQSALDRTLDTLEFHVDRRLTRALSAQFLVRLYRTDYTHVSVVTGGGSPDTDNESIAAGVTWRHGRGLEIKLQCEHTSYVTSPNDTGYRENRVYLTVGYRPLRAGAGSNARSGI